MGKFLIVDHTVPVVKSLMTLLAEFGFESISVTQSQAVVSVLEQESIDLVLLEADMPVISGLRLLRQLRQTERFQELPIIMVATAANYSMLHDCLEYGANDYLIKPFHTKVLLSRIRMVLKHSSQTHKLIQQVQHRDQLLTQERQKRFRVTEALGQYRKFSKLWAILPEPLQQTFSKILDILGDDKGSLDKHQTELLTQLTSQYADNLSKLLNVNALEDAVLIVKHRSRLALLEKISLFQDIKSSELMSLVYCLEEIEAEADRVLLTQGQPADSVYFVEEGCLEILVNGERVAQRNIGESVGEMSCLRGEMNASATVKTLLPSKILRIEREAFMEIVNSLPKLWQNVFRDTTTRFSQLSQRISELFQHTPQGLMKVDPQGKVSNEYSTQCTELLGVRQLTGKPVETLIFPKDEVQQEGWRQAFPILFEDSMMDFEMLIQLLPTETRFVLDNGTSRECRLSYYPCWSSQKKLVAVDIGLEDITEERRLAREQEALKLEKNIIQKIYDDPDSYLNLIQLAEETLNELADFEQHMDHPHQFNLVEMTRHLHTLKGISGIFLLNTMKSVVHTLEDHLKIDKTQETIPVYLRTKIRQGIAELNQQVQYAQAILENMETEVRRRLLGIVIDRDIFENLKDLVFHERWPEVTRYFRQMDQVPVRKLVQHWDQELGKLNEKLDKMIRLRIEGDQFPISQQLALALEGPLGHLLRNCADHGIELPEERLSLGKEEWGIITFRAWQKEQSIVLEIQDDGRGIPEEKVIEKAKKHPQLDQQLVHQHIEEHAVWKLLFIPGFSTAEQVTEVSGRGVGMDAVKTMVDEVGGTISIKSDQGKGSTFILTIPVHEEYSTRP
ncbi:MAG: response regulator [SAR324 cluster bacterium]|nr:response regulator [SAR324 cluster bacterium]